MQHSKNSNSVIPPVVQEALELGWRQRGATMYKEEDDLHPPPRVYSQTELNSAKAGVLEEELNKLGFPVVAVPVDMGDPLESDKRSRNTYLLMAEPKQVEDFFARYNVPFMLPQQLLLPDKIPDRNAKTLANNDYREEDRERIYHLLSKMRWQNDRQGILTSEETVTNIRSKVFANFMAKEDISGLDFKRIEKGDGFALQMNAVAAIPHFENAVGKELFVIPPPFRFEERLAESEGKDIAHLKAMRIGVEKEGPEAESTKIIGAEELESMKGPYSKEKIAGILQRVTWGAERGRLSLPPMPPDMATETLAFLHTGKIKTTKETVMGVTGRDCTLITMDAKKAYKFFSQINIRPTIQDTPQVLNEKDIADMWAAKRAWKTPMSEVATEKLRTEMWADYERERIQEEGKRQL